MSSYSTVRGILSSTQHSLIAPSIIDPSHNKIIKSYVGYVVSDKMQKTINVEVTQYYLHPLLRKYVKTSSRFMTHDESEEASYGDLVQIKQSRPLSKRKHWILHKILKPRKQSLLSQQQLFNTPLEQLRQQLNNNQTTNSIANNINNSNNNNTENNNNNNITATAQS